MCFKQKVLKPLLKWPGGKRSELSLIRESYQHTIPKTIDKYVEPFVGGGAFWLGLEANSYIVNDISNDLINLYSVVKNKDKSFIESILAVNLSWNELRDLTEANYSGLYNETISVTDIMKDLSLSVGGIDLFNTYFIKGFKTKLRNIKTHEAKSGKLSNDDLKDNIECALKSGLYTSIRSLYNSRKKMDGIKAMSFLFMREYCFSSMFRFNPKGDFNVPYGGISYNKKYPARTLDYFMSDELSIHMNKTSFYNEDFQSFVSKLILGKNDFMFIDPPYDTTFSSYDNREFVNEDQERLAWYLLNECKCNFLSIFKETDFIRSLYENKKSHVKCETFDKTYQVSFRDRNDKGVNHLIVYSVL